MLEKITIIALIVANILLWVSQFKMKMVLGAILKRELEFIDEIKKVLEAIK